MATLGEVLAAARKSASGLQRWLTPVEPELAHHTEQAAAELGMTSAGLARVAVAEFSRFASEDSWSGLLRILAESPDPGMDCLIFMLKWWLARERPQWSAAESMPRERTKS